MLSRQCKRMLPIDSKLRVVIQFIVFFPLATPSLCLASSASAVDIVKFCISTDVWPLAITHGFHE